MVCSEINKRYKLLVSTAALSIYGTEKNHMLVHTKIVIIFIKTKFFRVLTAAFFFR